MNRKLGESKGADDDLVRWLGSCQEDALVGQGQVTKVKELSWFTAVEGFCTDFIGCTHYWLACGEMGTAQALCWLDWNESAQNRAHHQGKDRVEHSAAKCLWHKSPQLFSQILSGLSFWDSPLLPPTFLGILPWVQCRILSFHGTLHGALPFFYFYFFLLLQCFLLG